MLQLFTAELWRFRVWSLTAGAAHLVVLAFLTRVVDLAQQPASVYRVMASIYCLTGVLFGLVQMSGYRKPNTWLQLLHRPLAPARIAASLIAAGALLLVVSVVVPISIVLSWQETMTARVVDARHWLLGLSGALLILCGYLTGAYCILARRRVALASGVFLVLLALHTASGAAALTVQLVSVLWLMAMVVVAFRPDLEAPPRHWFHTIALAMPLQLGTYYLLILLCFVYELLWVVSGSHPNNAARPGGAIEALKTDGGTLLQAGLSADDSELSALWREQVALSEVFELTPTFTLLPRRGDLTNPVPLEFDDARRRVRWVFSHDRMRFEGYSLVNSRSSGTLYLGAANQADFPDPVMPIKRLPVLPSGDTLLLSAGALYQYRSDLARILQRMQLPDSEVFATQPQMVGPSVKVLSDRALYFFDSRALREDESLLQPRLRVPMQGAIGNLSRATLIELVDGYLVSFTFATTVHDARVAPRQQLVHAHDDGRIDSIAVRELGSDYPPWYRYDMWWLSPVLNATHEAAVNLFARPDPWQRVEPPPIPREIWLLAAATSLLSVLLALLRTHQCELSRTSRLAWLLVCALIGLPALISLWLLLSAREQVRALTPARAAA